MSAQSVLSLTGRARPAETPERPAAPVAAAPSASERRLKLVIESAPVSLLITDPENKVLAANRVALALLGVERLDDVIGKTLDRLVAPADRERFVAFVGSVCRGESGTLQYDIALSNGTQRTMETHAVPLRREASAPAAFLGATWDVSEKKTSSTALQQLQQKVVLLEAQRSAERDTWEEALRQARAAHDEMSSGQNRYQTALGEAEERHSHMAAQWAAERNGLLEQVKAAEGRQGDIAGRWTSERDNLLEQLKAVEARQERAASEWGGQRDALVDKLRTADEQQSHLANQWAAERDALLGKLRDVEDRHETLSAQLLIEQNVQRTALEQVERDHQAALASRAAEREHLEQALRDQSAAQHGLQDALNAAKTTQDQLAEERQRTQSALEEAEAQRDRQAAQWASEREGMLARLIALEHAQREYQASLTARNSEVQQLEKANKDAGGRYEQLLGESRTQRDELSGRLEDLERRSTAAAERWHSELAEVLSPLKDSSARVERLLHDFRNIRTGADAVWTAGEEQPAQPTHESSDAGDAEAGEETTWRF